VKPISLLQALGMAWFIASIVLQVFTTVFFVFWLRRRGAKLIFGLTGVPGYLELQYLDLCRRQGRSAKTILTLRAILLISALLAAIVVVPLAIMT